VDDDVYGVAIQPDPGPAITIYRMKEITAQQGNNEEDA
jgi:hypothetical protein